MPTAAAPPMQNQLYRSHGLTVASCLPLPFARQTLPCESATDVIITRHAKSGTSPGGGESLTYGDGITVDIQSGERIDVRAPVDSEPALLGALITTGPWKALMLQRGLIPFRGCAVCQDGGAVAIVGRRGVGASTLALELMNAGARLVSDGLFTVERDDGGRPCVPSGQIRLDAWEDSIMACAGDRARIRLRPETPRYGVPEPPPPLTPPVLHRVLLIAPGFGETTAVRPMTATEGLERILSLTDRHVMVRFPALRPHLLQTATAMVAAASIQEISLGRDLMTGDGGATLKRLGLSAGEA